MKVVVYDDNDKITYESDCKVAYVVHDNRQSDTYGVTSFCNGSGTKDEIMYLLKSSIKHAKNIIKKQKKAAHHNE